MIPLEDEFKEQRAISLTQLIEQDVLDAWGRYQKVRENRELYFGTATADMPLPWPGASNIHLPVIQEKVETLVPMLQAALWGVEPVVNCERSPEEFNMEQTDTVEQAMNFFVTKDIPNMYETCEGWMRDMTLDGLATISPDWERKMRDVSELHTLKSMYELGEPTATGQPAPEARLKAGLELLVDLFGAVGDPTGLLDARMIVGKDETEPVGTQWIARFLQDRVLYVAHITYMEGIRIDEVRAQVRRTIIEREGARVDLLEFEDVIVPYRTSDLQTADRVTHRYWLTVDEIEEKRDAGEWELSDKEMEILRASATREYDNSHINPQLQEQKDSFIGEDRAYKSEKVAAVPIGFAPYNRNKVLIFRVFLRDAVEKGGSRTEVIYHIPYALRTIVRADYLDMLFPHGKRPFITGKYLPISDRWAALGIGDQLAAINLEVNTIVNFVNNNQELINNPFYFYEPTAMNADSRGVTGVRPGQGIPVMSVAGILFPKFPQQPLANMEAMTTLLMFGDRVTMSPMNAGSSQMKNAPRTARGTLALLGEGHVKTDMLITRLQRGPWTELMEQIHGLYQEFCPDEKWYYVTRADGARKPNQLTREKLRGRYEFTFKGNTVNTNREVLRTLAQVRYSTIMTHPDYSTDPHVRRAAIKDFLKYWGEGTDIDRLIPALPGEGAYTHPPMSQQDENKAMELGVPMQVLPTDDHATHLTEMDRYEKSQAFDMQPAHIIGVMAMHKLGHQQGLQAQAQQQTLPVGPGTANNVPTGPTLAGGSDLGSLEGGNVR